MAGYGRGMGRGNGAYRSNFANFNPMEEDYNNPHFNSYAGGLGSRLGISQTLPGAAGRRYKLFVGKIPLDLTEIGLRNLFLTYGIVLDVYLYTGMKRFNSEIMVTWGLVTFGYIGEAEMAIRKLNGTPPYFLKVTFARTEEEKADRRRFAGNDFVLLRSPSPPPPHHIMPQRVVQKYESGVGRGQVMERLRSRQNKGFYLENDEYDGPSSMAPQLANKQRALSQCIEPQLGDEHVYKITPLDAKTKERYNANIISKHFFNLKENSLYQFGDENDFMEELELGQCLLCGDKESRYKCGSCSSGFYCSRVCQVKDWHRHKPDCVPTGKTAVGGRGDASDNKPPNKVVQFDKEPPADDTRDAPCNGRFSKIATDRHAKPFERQLPANPNRDSGFSKRTDSQTDKYESGGSVNSRLGRNAGGFNQHYEDRRQDNKGYHGTTTGPKNCMPWQQEQTEPSADVYQGDSSKQAEPPAGPSITGEIAVPNVISPVVVALPKIIKTVTPAAEVVTEVPVTVPQMKKSLSNKAEPPTTGAKKNALLPSNVFTQVVVAFNTGDDNVYWVQPIEKFMEIEEFSKQLQDFSSANKLEPLVSPTVNAKVAAIFADQWFRAKVKSVEPKLEIFFVDYGNDETCSKDSLRVLPAQFCSIPPQACKIRLAEGTPREHFCLEPNSFIVVKPVEKDASGVWTVHVKGVDYKCKPLAFGQPQQAITAVSAVPLAAPKTAISPQMSPTLPVPTQAHTSSSIPSSPPIPPSPQVPSTPQKSPTTSQTSTSPQIVSTPQKLTMPQISSSPKILMTPQVFTTPRTSIKDPAANTVAARLQMPITTQVSTVLTPSMRQTPGTPVAVAPSEIMVSSHLLPSGVFTKVVLTEVVSKDTYWVSCKSYEKLAHEIAKQLTQLCPHTNPVKASVGDIGAALYMGFWYRAKVLSLDPLSVFFIDYGNKDIIPDDCFRVIPGPWEINNQPPLAVQVQLAPGTSEKYFNLQVDTVMPVDTLSFKPVKKLPSGITLVHVEGDTYTTDAVRPATPPKTDNCASSTQNKWSERATELLQVGDCGLLEIQWTYSDSVCVVTITPESEQLSNALIVMLADLQKLADCPIDETYKPLCGENVGALNDSDYWGRGYVLVGGLDVHVAMVDQGRVITPRRVVPLPQRFLTFPPLSFKCMFHIPIQLNEANSMIEFKVTDKTGDSMEAELPAVGSRCTLGQWVPKFENVKLCSVPLASGALVQLSIISSGGVYVRPTDPQTTDTFCSLLQDVGEHCSKVGPLTGKPSRGDLLACLFDEDEQYYRAQVIKSIGDDKYLVTFLDFGNNTTASAAYMKELPANLKRIPRCVVKVGLKDVDIGAGLWNESCTTLGNELFKTAEELRVVFEGDDLSQVTLYRKDGTTTLNKQLSAFLVPDWKKALESGSAVKQEVHMISEQVFDPWPVGETVSFFLAAKLDDSVICCWKKNSKYFGQMTVLSDSLQEYGNNVPEVAYNPRINEMCVVRFTEDNMWYRAVCEQTNVAERTSEVLFVDYGNSCQISHDDIRPMVASLMATPVIAAYLHLHGVPKPSEQGASVEAIRARIDELLTAVDVPDLDCRVLSHLEDNHYLVWVAAIMETLRKEDLHSMSEPPAT